MGDDGEEGGQPAASSWNIFLGAGSLSTNHSTGFAFSARQTFLLSFFLSFFLSFKTQRCFE